MIHLFFSLLRFCSTFNLIRDDLDLTRSFRMTKGEKASFCCLFTLSNYLYRLSVPSKGLRQRNFKVWDHYHLENEINKVKQLVQQKFSFFLRLLLPSKRKRLPHPQCRSFSFFRTIRTINSPTPASSSAASSAPSAHRGTWRPAGSRGPWRPPPSASRFS
ncbi:hypothetical protein BH24BAC1_BH24BAC1_31860 [soil metagenome]